MAKFCGNCGTQLDDDARVCGCCGTPVDGEKVKTKTINPGIKKKIKTIGILSLMGIVVLIAGIITFNTISYMNGYEKPIKEFVSAMSDFDIDKLLTVSSEIGMTDDSMYDIDEKLSSVISSVLDNYELSVGYDVKLDCKVTESYILPERKYLEFINYIEEMYYYDTSYINDIVYAKVDIIAKGVDGEKTFSDQNVYVIKEDGKWGVYLGNVNLSNSYNSFNYIY